VNEMGLIVTLCLMTLVFSFSMSFVIECIKDFFGRGKSWRD